MSVSNDPIDKPTLLKQLPYGSTSYGFKRSPPQYEEAVLLQARKSIQLPRPPHLGSDLKAPLRYSYRNRSAPKESSFPGQYSLPSPPARSPLIRLPCPPSYRPCPSRQFHNSTSSLPEPNSDYHVPVQSIPPEACRSTNPNYLSSHTQFLRTSSMEYSSLPSLLSLRTAPSTSVPGLCKSPPCSTSDSHLKYQLPQTVSSQVSWTAQHSTIVSQTMSLENSKPVDSLYSAYSTPAILSKPFTTANSSLAYSPSLDSRSVTSNLTLTPERSPVNFSTSSPSPTASTTTKEPQTSSFTSTFLKGILSSIDSKDPVVAGAWLETILDAIDLLPRDVIQTEVVLIAIGKAQKDQTLTSRISACRLLGKISVKLDTEVLQDTVMPVVVGLCKDGAEEVRLAMCQQIEHLASASEDVAGSLVPIFKDLASDESSKVRLSALETIMSLVESLKCVTFVKQIVNVVIKIVGLGKKTEDQTLIKISSIFGKICHSLSGSLNDEQKSWFASFFRELAIIGIQAPAETVVKNKTSGETSPMPDLLPPPNPEKSGFYAECRLKCAFNFPGMILFCGPENFPKVLCSTFSSLATDPTWRVRCTMAKGLHEIANLVSSDFGLLKMEICGLFADSHIEVLEAMVANMVHVVDALARQGVLPFAGQGSNYSNDLSRALLNCEETISLTRNWRLQADCLEKFSCLANCISPYTIMQKFIPLLFARMLRARTLPCRIAAARTVLVILRFTVKAESRCAIESMILRELGAGKSCRNRMLFLVLCEMAIALFSKQYFKNHFFAALLQLAQDQVPNVRLKLAAILPRLKSVLVLPSDYVLLQQLEDTVEKLVLNEKDGDVLQCVQKSIHDLDAIVIDGNHLPDDEEERDNERKFHEELLIASMEEQLFKQDNCSAKTSQPQCSPLAPNTILSANPDPMRTYNPELSLIDKSPQAPDAPQATALKNLSTSLENLDPSAREFLVDAGILLDRETIKSHHENTSHLSKLDKALSEKTRPPEKDSSNELTNSSQNISEAILPGLGHKTRAQVPVSTRFERRSEVKEKNLSRDKSNDDLKTIPRLNSPHIAKVEDQLPKKRFSVTEQVGSIGQQMFQKMMHRKSFNDVIIGYSDGEEARSSESSDDLEDSKTTETSKQIRRGFSEEKSLRDNFDRVNVADGSINLVVNKSLQSQIKPKSFASPMKNFPSGKSLTSMGTYRFSSPQLRQGLYAVPKSTSTPVTSQNGRVVYVVTNPTSATVRNNASLEGIYRQTSQFERPSNHKNEAQIQSDENIKAQDVTDSRMPKFTRVPPPKYRPHPPLLTQKKVPSSTSSQGIPSFSCSLNKQQVVKSLSAESILDRNDNLQSRMMSPRITSPATTGMKFSNAKHSVTTTTTATTTTTTLPRQKSYGAIPFLSSNRASTTEKQPASQKSTFDVNEAGPKSKYASKQISYQHRMSTQTTLMRKFSDDAVGQTGNDQFKTSSIQKSFKAPLTVRQTPTQRTSNIPLQSFGNVSDKPSLLRKPGTFTSRMQSLK